MPDIMFFIKAIVVSLVIVMIMQVKIDKVTLEDHASMFIKHSTLMSPLQEVAAAGVKATRSSIKWVSKQVNTHVTGKWNKKKPEQNNYGGVSFQRSESYRREQEKKARDAEEAASEESSSSSLE